MATIDMRNVRLAVRLGGGQTTVEAATGTPARFHFNSPTIDADATIRLTGTAGENVADWTLGFIQLKYIGTNHARYRGAADNQGSALVSHSNQTLCRDTDTGTRGVWYDSLDAVGGTRGPDGTNRLSATETIPATGFLEVPAHLSDQPDRYWAAVRPNGVVAGHPDNFLHYVVVELLFCTMLVAQDPTGNFTMLKHFYWNVIWEHTFKRNQAGLVVRDKAIRLQQNVQHPVHSGNPRDPKFLGKEYDTTLPVSNTVSRAAPTIIEARNWSQG